MRSRGELAYEDFEVEISLGRGQEYPVAVINSPAGEAHETMHFPFDELALENNLLILKNALLQSGGKYRLALSQEEQAVQKFGKALWNALLTGEVRNRYDVSLERANREGKGLRLKLRIQEPKLAAIPWEFMYEPRQKEYMCLSRSISVVRYLELPQPVQPLAVEPPLRILGMAVSPTNLCPLDIAREKQRVEEAIKSLQADGLVELTWLQGQTWRDLQEAMQTGIWHIFYFIGHGGFDCNIDEGLIALADEEGKSQHFRATHLGRLLADHRSLRLVILNSCEGARGSEHDIFSCTASILVQRGIPAVLAMQYEITDKAAIEFSRAFYKALANGLPVDAAVTEARKAVSFAIENTIEWGTPVLYMRSHDGVLFNVQEQKPKDKADRSKQKKQKGRETKEQSFRQEEERGERKGLEKEQRDIELRDKEAKEAQFQPQKAEQLEKERREQEARLGELSALYSKGIEALGAQDWQTAIKHFNDILILDASYSEAGAKLKEAEQQLGLVKKKERQQLEEPEEERLKKQRNEQERIAGEKEKLKEGQRKEKTYNKHEIKKPEEKATVDVNVGKEEKELDLRENETIFNKIKKIFGKIKKDEIKRSPVKKIANIDFPSSINLNQKYPLIVRLLNDKVDKVPEGRIVVLGYAKGIEEIKIIVTLDAKDFEIENSEQEMKVPLMKDSETLVFYLTPKSIGKKKIRLKFYQDENYNGEVFIETTIYKQESIEEARVKVVPHGEVGIHIGKQKFEDLRIEAEIDKDYLEYKVTSRILGLFNKKCRTQERLHEPRLFVNKMLKELSDISSATYDEDEKYKRTISKIETVGMDLYKRLIPEELKQILWNNKDKIDSMFIVTDEEWIPWEIIKSYRITEDGDMEKDDFWGMKYVIGRWLSGHFPWEQIFVKKSVVIANDYNGTLKYVMKEKENIEKIFRSKNVEILPIIPGRLETLDLLSDKVINLLHFACDSTYDELYPDDSYIKLLDDELKAADIGVRNLRRGKPLIFINACQSGRADYAFSGIGGFAKAFLDVGALAFIGTIWKIPDELSMRFSEEFYRNVFEKNMSLGESLRETKHKFSTSKNPAWLSYSLYSFPLAEIII